MNKKQLIARVQRLMGPGTDRATASAAVEAVLSSICATVRREKVHLPGFGSFDSRPEPPRRYYDINSGIYRETKAQRRLCFRPAAGLLPPELARLPRRHKGNADEAEA